MNSKSQHQIRLLILGIVFVIAIIVVIVSVNNNNKSNNNPNNVGQQPNNVDTNYTQTSDGTKVNTSDEVSENKQVGDVLIEQSKIVYNNGTAVLTSRVTNNGVAKDNLRFKIKFMANDGTVITEAVGFVGQIKANETKTITSSITLDTSNAKNVVYELIP